MQGVCRTMLGHYASTTAPNRSTTIMAPHRARAPLHHQQARGAPLIMHNEDVRGSHMEKALFGENFGARDAFAGEVATGFGNKALGFASTEHIVKPPDKIRDIVGLSSKRCIPCEGGDVPKLSDHDVERLKKQVPGWKLAVDRSGVQCIRHEWTVRNFAAGLQLFGRIGEVAEQQGHHPDLHLEGYNKVYADLSTHSLGGLTENDFIMAAKINELDVGDLLPKKKPRFWA